MFRCCNLSNCVRQQTCVIVRPGQMRQCCTARSAEKDAAQAASGSMSRAESGAGESTSGRPPPPRDNDLLRQGQRA